MTQTTKYFKNLRTSQTPHKPQNGSGGADWPAVGAGDCGEGH
jgi:hypothetical protein